MKKSLLLAGIVAGALLAVSYTFWTQAIIAEVYTLHLTLVGLCLLALAWYATRPSTARLAGFCAHHHHSRQQDYYGNDDHSFRPRLES